MGERAFDKVGEPARRAGLLVLALVASLLVVLMLGTPIGPMQAVGVLVLKLGAVWPAVVYLGAGVGLGWPIVRALGATGRSPVSSADGGSGPAESQHWTLSSGTRGLDAVPVQAAVGLAVMFSLSEVLGVLGLLNAATAIGVCVVGLVLLGWQIVSGARAGGRIEVPGLAWMLAWPAVAGLIVAAAMPPVWLWGSEYGGFDALSYHLQLPQEWLADGPIAPLEHNVYSYLPGYIEAAFTHLGYLTLAPPEGLLGGDGWRLLSCQALHAGLALIAAWLTARATARLAMNLGVEERVARWAGAIAGCVAIATPWAVVTGSLAYNEAGVNAMLAGALLVGVQPGLRGSVRGGLVGLLVGVACGFKPTALLFAGIPAGLFMVYGCGGDADGRRALRSAVVVGAVVGLLALSPWLVRNWAHGGNPVFPFAAETFGAAHWSDEQVERYQEAHSFDGTIADRVRMLVWTSPVSSPGDPAVVRFRGLTNPQWGLLVVFVPVSLVVLLVGWRAARPAALLLVLSLIGQAVCWGAFTHLQSRFLLPLLPPSALVIGLGLARLRTLAGSRPDGRTGVALLGGVVVVVQLGFLIGIYGMQRDGSPGRALAVFPSYFTGNEEGAEEDTAAGFCHRLGPEDGLVYLVGDSTPLYFGNRVVYHTTYDRSPLGELMREHPDDPAAWAAGLRGRGIAWLVVNPRELARLQESGWYDPLVTPGAVQDFAETLDGVVHLWMGEERYLVRLAAEPLAEGDS